MQGFLPLLAVLTLIEILALTFVYDIHPLTERSGLAHVVGAGGGLLPLLFIGPVVFAVVRDSALQNVAARLGRAPVRPSRAGLALAVHAVAIVLFTALTSRLLTTEAPTNGQVVLWLVAAPLVPGLTWLAARPRVDVGPAWRAAAPALALGAGLAAFVWAMGLVSAALWHRLYPVVLVPVHALLRLTVDDVVYEPAAQNMGTDRFLINIAPECSGLEGLGLLVSLAVLVIAYHRREWSWPRAAALIVFAAVLSWVANVTRITLLIAIGDGGYPDVALGGFHSKAGWALYTLIGVAMLVAVRPRSPPSSPDQAGLAPAEVFLGPVLAFTAAGLLTSLSAASGFDALYWVRFLAGGLALAGTVRALRRHGVPLSDAGRAGAPATAIGIGVITYGLWLLLAPGPVNPDLVAGLKAMPAVAATVWVAIRIASTVLLVPIIEELAFRGYLLRRVSSAEVTEVPFSRFEAVPVLVSAVAFGAMHGAFVAGAAAGVLYAAAQARGGHLRDAVIAHATTNTLIVVQAFAEWPPG